MNSREALYHVVMALGPIPKSERDDNITYDEATLRDAVDVLKELVDEQEFLLGELRSDEEYPIGYDSDFREAYNPEHHVPDHCKCKGEDCGKHANSPLPEGIGQRESDLVDVQSLEAKIVTWHHARNLIEGSTDKDQFCKLLQEVGELSESICKGKDVADDIGDIIVVLINIAERNALDITDCLIVAWEDIKFRKGRMVDGVFVKETDWT
jgi:hypothetical protein